MLLLSALAGAFDGGYSSPPAPIEWDEIPSTPTPGSSANMSLSAGTGAVAIVARLNINIQLLRPWPVLIPTDDEQRKIVAILEAIDRKIDLHVRRWAVPEDLFKALLHKLMTREI